MNERTRFVGLDVHKATIAVAVAGSFGDPEDHGQIANDPGAVRKLLTRLGDDGAPLSVAYEAGPTGYALYRQVTAMGIECLVVAPSLIPVRPGDRVKTDRRDAAKLARLLRSGDLTRVWEPDEAGEALRDLVRARDDAKADQLRAKHRLSKFLLRRAVHPPVGVRAWSRAHEAWLAKVSFVQVADQVVFEDYRSVVAAVGELLDPPGEVARECVPGGPAAVAVDEAPMPSSRERALRRLRWRIETSSANAASTIVSRPAASSFRMYSRRCPSRPRVIGEASIGTASPGWCGVTESQPT